MANFARLAAQRLFAANAERIAERKILGAGGVKFVVLERQTRIKIQVKKGADFGRNANIVRFGAGGARVKIACFGTITEIKGFIF